MSNRCVIFFNFLKYEILHPGGCLDLLNLIHYGLENAAKWGKTCMKLHLHNFCSLYRNKFSV